jgi:hypothetical protein
MLSTRSRAVAMVQRLMPAGVPKSFHHRNPVTGHFKTGHSGSLQNRPVWEAFVTVIGHCFLPLCKCVFPLLWLGP